MKLPYSLALGMQDWLRVLTYDCYVADSFTSGLVDSTEYNVRWQTAVDTLYRFVKSDLLWAPPASDKDPALTQEDYLAYIQSLARNNPFLADPYIAWQVKDFCLTEAGRALANKHKLRELSQGTLNEAFADELAQRFDAYGVGWREAPLIPVQHALGQHALGKRELDGN